MSNGFVFSNKFSSMELLRLTDLLASSSFVVSVKSISFGDSALGTVSSSSIMTGASVASLNSLLPNDLLRKEF